jgi:N-acylneuraminate cytidylyltransferase
VIALIPARGGSKRLPRKNIRPFAGKPLLHWSVALGRALPEVTRTIVSTDDAEIAEIARASGAIVSMRPRELATDEATTASVVKFVLGELAREGHATDGVVLLQPNCPLRPLSLVEDAIAAFRARRVDSVVSVTLSHQKRGHVVEGLFRPEYQPGTRSQDMPPAYFENGVVYVSDAERVMRTGDLFGERVFALETEPLFALGDIDTELDFQVAEHLFRLHHERFALPETPCAHSS